MAGVLTPQAEDFPRWYQDVVAKAELAENGPVRGTMVIRPLADAFQSRMVAEMDARIKACGAQNAYFPLFIPLDYFQREAEHVEGFSPELAIVTIGGGKELEEPFAVRPTSETIIGEYMAKWVQSYRDLPLLLNQWANVVRWELRTRLFLRSSEFLWQEGHTAHATFEDARNYAVRILHEAYEDFMVQVLALPVYVGRKTSAERFPGAINSMTLEGMMADGKALQMGTSHELGQNFARVFDMLYLDADGQQQLCWTRSCAASPMRSTWCRPSCWRRPRLAATSAPSTARRSTRSSTRRRPVSHEPRGRSSASRASRNWRSPPSACAVCSGPTARSRT